MVLNTFFTSPASWSLVSASWLPALDGGIPQPHDVIILGPFACGRKQTHTGKELKIWLFIPANFVRVSGKRIYFYNGKLYPWQ